ncbi:MAG: hypothetical protein K2X61_03865 [Caulobacteraceae bacterium]|nr:hypothetical protein [Caulobacteraceae bacterium]
MIRLSLNREPVTVRLRPPLADIELTLRRLTTVDFNEARQAARVLCNNSGKLQELMSEYQLLPGDNSLTDWKRMRTQDPLAYSAHLLGVEIWVSSVECAVRGIVAWTGLVGDDGKPLPVSRPAIEALMLVNDVADQILSQLDQAAQLIILEGKP